MAERYPLEAMVKTNSELKNHLIKTPKGLSIDFSDSNAVKVLNTALLNHYYGIEYWDFPKENLVPPVPGRADYIHHIADVLDFKSRDNITGIDIGTGASLIYPIIAVMEYRWNMLAVDSDKQSIQSCQKIINQNSRLKEKIKLQIQPNKNHFFKNVIKPEDKFDFSMCNPPFYSNKEEADKENIRKNRNLKNKTDSANRNFKGKHSEIVYPGGEKAFIKNMIKESTLFKNNIKWFSTLVSSGSNLKSIEEVLKNNKISSYKIIDNSHGSKKSRIIFWTFN